MWHLPVNILGSMVVDKPQGPYPSRALQFWGIDTHNNKNTYNLYEFSERIIRTLWEIMKKAYFSQGRQWESAVQNYLEHCCAAVLSRLDGILYLVRTSFVLVAHQVSSCRQLMSELWLFFVLSRLLWRQPIIIRVKPVCLTKV